MYMYMYMHVQLIYSHNDSMLAMYIVYMAAHAAHDMYTCTYIHVHVHVCVLCQALYCAEHMSLSHSLHDGGAVRQVWDGLDIHWYVSHSSSGGGRPLCLHLLEHVFIMVWYMYVCVIVSLFHCVSFSTP